MKDIKEFIDNYREAFGDKAQLPLVFGYSDIAIADTKKIGGCFFKGLQEAREGNGVSLSADVIGCGGGKLYTGFADMPEHVPNFVSLKEKYKLTPKMVVDYINSLELKKTTKRYLNFQRIDKVESFDWAEGVLFYATPDVLSGLCGWAFYDNNYSDAVVTKFGSGCSTVVSMTVSENARHGHQCYIGLLDASVRPWVGENELSFSVPMSRFTEMMKTMRQSFLFDAPAWQRLKSRM